MNALLPLELAWRGINRARRAMYRRDLLGSRRLPRPVISIGNISVGGSGKTPAVIHVAKFLTSRGWRVAILSRGYGRSGTDRFTIVDTDDAARFGDEPVLIRRHVPECDVVVGADRFQAGSWYLTRHDCDVFVLDDGFQHLQLQRDIDIVIDDPRAPHLREGRTALKDADMTLVRTSGELPEGSYRLDVEPTTLVLGGEQHGLGMFVGRKVLAFAGLANNERFFKVIESLGGHLVGHESFRDHKQYDEELLTRLKRLQDEIGADLLVTTEKDWVKFPTLDVGVLLVEAVVTPLADFHQHLVELLETSCKRHGRIPPPFERKHG